MSAETRNTPVAENDEQYSLSDDRRVKVLSPGAMVMKRFFRNRLAITGLVILVAMFLFSYVGGIVSPYRQDEVFYREDYINKEYVAITENKEYRFLELDEDFNAIVQAQTILNIQKGTDSFSYKDTDYTLEQEGESFYSIYAGDALIGAAYRNILAAEDTSATFPAQFQYEVQHALAAGGGSFAYEGADYEVDAEGVVTQDGEAYAVCSPYIIQSKTAGVVVPTELRGVLIEAVMNGGEPVAYTDENGNTAEYEFVYDAATGIWSVMQETATRVFDTYSFPTKTHWLGTDRNGMDMLTRLMYGGRVSLMIGFIVVIMESVLGVILGGIAGYFGKWVDNLIMRIVDVFYCIPSTPMIIILGAAMDAMRVDPQIRMIYLMLVLGFLGWPSIARMVRGQILSLREQEFMVATEACGIRVSRRIFRHLIPNVIPQLIVISTMSLGSTIIMESTLSFLGLGVKFPFASWGNIINDVSNSYVLTSYWFIWIPAGVCLMLTVLAFNFVGDGLRDAFDPKMKR